MTTLDPTAELQHRLRDARHALGGVWVTAEGNMYREPRTHTDWFVQACKISHTLAIVDGIPTINIYYIGSVSRTKDPNEPHHLPDPEHPGWYFKLGLVARSIHPQHSDLFIEHLLSKLIPASISSNDPIFRACKENG